jgi:hypothetical protein
LASRAFDATTAVPCVGTMPSRHTRRLSCGHVEGVEAVRHRVDAIDATLKFGNVRKQTLSH